MNSYLYIKFNNCSFDKIINKLSLINVSVYNIENRHDGIYVKVLAKDYPKITKYLKTLKIEKIRYTGVEYIKRILKQYQIIFIASLLSIFFIIFCSFFIVDIKVVHEDDELVKIVYEELNNYGIKKFSFRKKYQYLQEVKKEIKNKHLDIIDWIEINKKGMIYIVRVEERIINKEEIKPEYCAIYAKKDGLIKKIKVFNGESVIEINDYVKKGDLLVSGDVMLNDNSVAQVCAEGEIFAEVWYEVNLKIPLVFYENIKTGKIRKNIIFNYNGIDYQLFKDRIMVYEEEKTLLFDLLGVKVYLKNEIEVEKVLRKMTIDEAQLKAQQIAKEKINAKIQDKGKIIEQKILQKSVIDSTMNIDIFIVAEEEIAKQIKLEKGNVQ